MARSVKRGARRQPERKEPRDWLAFRWWVSESYEWADGRAHGTDNPEAGPWLVERGELGTQYSPWHDSDRAALYLDFADVTERGTALSFARRYGLLGLWEHILPAGATSGRPLRAEPLALWVREAALMRAAIEVMKAARAKNTRRLEEWIQLRKWGAAFSHPDVPSGMVKPALGKDSAYGILGPKRPGLGLLFVQRLVNAKLEHGVTAARVLADRKTPDSPGDLVLGITPLHLLGAAWLQLAQALTGESTTRFRRCAGCNKWLPIGPGAGREDRSTCGDTCYRRVKRAREREGSK